MAKEIARAASLKNNASVQGKRRLEVLAFVFPALLIVVGTISYLVCKRMNNSKVDYICTNSSNQHMENITGAESLDNGILRAEEGMVYPSGSYWTSDDATIWGCPCLLKPCLHKCCGKEETLIYEDYVPEVTNDTEYDYEGEENERMSQCATLNVTFDVRNRGVYSKNNFDSPEQVQLEDGHFFLIYDGCQGKSRLFYSDEENNNSFLLEDGKLLRMKFKQFDQKLWDTDDFCADSSNESTAINFFICHEETAESIQRNETELTYTLRGSSMLLSVPFLFATGVVFTLLPPLQNLHGKALICHVASLMVAYSGLGLINLSTKWFEDNKLFSICKAVAFLIQFTLLTSFFWLNVMCFDIWWVFSGLMPLRGSQKAAEQIKFRLYSMYAWGCPVVILTLSLIMEYAPGIPITAIRPAMGVTGCFFKDFDSKLLYLYLPIGVLVYLNIVMFLTTSLRFKSHSNSVKRLERGDSRRHCKAKVTSDMQRFSLYLKLFIVMGVNWILELLSFIIDSDSVVWLVVDISNALQGLVIFYIFVCKRRVLIMLQQRFGFFFLDLSPDVSIKTSSSARSTSSAKLSTLRCKISNEAESLTKTSEVETSA